MPIKCNTLKISKIGHFFLLNRSLVIFSAKNYGHVIYCWKENFKEKSKMIVKKYRNEVNKNGMLFKGYNRAVDELFTLSFNCLNLLHGWVGKSY